MNAKTSHWKVENDRLRDDNARLLSENVRLTAELSIIKAENARLAIELSEITKAAEVWLRSRNGLASQRDRLEAECERLREENARLAAALRRAVDSDGGLYYKGDDDEVGNHSCCLTLSFKPHTHDCWVVQARAALSAVPSDSPADVKAIDAAVQQP